MKLLPVALALGLFASAGLAIQDAGKAKKSDAAVIAEQLPSYPLETCPVSGEALGSMGDPLDKVHEGRLVRFCCKGCVKKFEAEPEKTFDKIDAAVIAAQKASYPFDTCIVSEEPLDAMGKPVDVVSGTRLARFCCKGCVKKFKAEPAKFIAVIDEGLIAQQMKTYPLTTCLVSGNPIEGEGVSMLYGTRLARFCCEKCPEAFKKSPGKYLAKLEAAKGKAKAEDKKGL